MKWAEDSGYNFSIVRNTLKRQFVQLGYKTKRVNGKFYATGIALKGAKKGEIKPGSWV